MGDKEVRLIDANALMKRIEEVYCKDCNSHNGVMCRACEHMDDMGFIEDAPTIDAQPVKRGKWLEVRRHRDADGKFTVALSKMREWSTIYFSTEENAQKCANWLNAHWKESTGELKIG